MYYWLLPDLKDAQLGHVSAMIASGGFGNVSSKATIDRLMGPFVKELEAITGLPFNYTSTLSRKASTMYTATNEPSDEVGRRVILGSRIMTPCKPYPDETVEGQNAIQGLVVAGPAVKAKAATVDSALHPV
ncbi:hypothetical protein FOTG_11795 [Fusarium oxysporum f. sp. vasinfectum 25433]|uniref:Uncharacterized protein n=1 Tax=Fusarium oxysporum f. sp. vasinfectum 25433 TaxID=1089449 RepID=X0LGP3_FUSOX|nr:hypothetical protein FOTG_11795 [Fusarium oxysporum f. sp. vasinfectum 25433]